MSDVPFGTRAGSPPAMPRRLRATVLGVSALLWLSGIAWLVLHLWFEPSGEFGPLPHPWEAGLMKVHGMVAVAAVFLLGWLGAGHVFQRCRSARNRISGWALVGSAGLLVFTGYALYYSLGAAHTGSAWVHEWLGAATIFVALAHWLRIRRPE
ncbi:MAG: DUF4405 domain-containing protein [Proteobacteria bacterium]|nr:DUF4405 domain-containing protein [Pseudomonadota bacterium]